MQLKYMILKSGISRIVILPNNLNFHVQLAFPFGLNTPNYMSFEPSIQILVIVPSKMLQ
jgi:hypothetical protein